MSGFVCAQETTSNTLSAGDTSSNELPRNQVKLSGLSERFEIGEELIVTVRVGQFNYGEVFAVVSEQGLYVSPEELIALFDFPISEFATDEAYQLKGWFISEQRTFELEMFDTLNENGVGQVTIQGNSSYITAEQYLEVAGDKLLNFDLVGSWFGLSLSFDSERLSVNAVASIPLPAQLKLKREKRQLNDLGHRIPTYPNFDFGYFARSHQMFDASINANYIQEDLSAYYSVVGIQDLAGFSTRFFVRGTDDDVLQNANVNFKRQSTEANLLGPLNATTIEFGDIRAARVAGVTGGQTIGVNINNQKLGQAYDFEFTNISGVIQEGWDVELYHNGILTRKELNTTGGQYEFLDLPLFAQLNTFEVVKYGPQGQILRERVERNLDNQTFSATPRYNVSLTKSNSSLLLDDNNSDEQDLLLSGVYSYSFRNWLSTSFSHNNNLSDSAATYSLSTTARLSPRLLSNFSYTFVDSDQQSLGLSLQSRLFNQFANLSYSRSFLADSAYNDALSIRMAGNLYQGDIGRFSYSNDFRGRQQSNGDYTQTIGNTLTLSSRYGFLSHSLNYQAERTGDVRETYTSGGITFGGTKGKFNARFNANYELNDEESSVDWLSVDTSLNYEFYNDLSTQFRFSRALESDLDSYQWSVQWSQPSYAIFSSVTHNSNNDTNVSLNARFSMSEAPFGQGYINSSTPLTSNALVAVRVYEDVNQNFIFDEGDRPIENVKVSADQLTRIARSDKDGIAVFEGIGSFRQTDLKVDTESLDDPYLLQSTVNTSLTPRGGLLTLINYPFVQGIEFEGEFTASAPNNDSTEVMNNAPIEIYRSNGDLVKVVKTEYDGYFYSGILFPDTYTLKVSEDYLARNELVFKQTIVIKAKKSGTFIPDVQISSQRLNYKDSFQPYIGSFASERMAKAYLNLVRGKYASMNVSNELSLHKSNKDNKYYVGFGVYASEELAASFCQNYRRAMPSCKVNKDRYKYVAAKGGN